MEILRDSWYIKDQIRPSLGREVHCKLEALTYESILKFLQYREWKYISRG